MLSCHLFTNLKVHNEHASLSVIHIYVPAHNGSLVYKYNIIHLIVYKDFSNFTIQLSAIISLLHVHVCTYISLFLFYKFLEVK